MLVVGLSRSGARDRFLLAVVASLFSPLFTNERCYLAARRVHTALLACNRRHRVAQVSSRLIDRKLQPGPSDNSQGFELIARLTGRRDTAVGSGQGTRREARRIGVGAGRARRLGKNR